MQHAHRQALAAATLEVEIELLGANLAGAAGDAGQQGAAAARDEIGELETARAHLRQIVVEPRRQRGVHVAHLARRVAGEETGRRVVQEVDRVLKLLEDVLVPLTLARHVGDRPEAGPLGTREGQRTDPHAIPADIAGRAVERRRQAQLLGRPLAVARRLGEAIDRLGHFGRSGEQALDAAQVGRATGVREFEVGVVGVEELAARVGNQHALGAGVADDARDIVLHRLAGELDDADRIAEQSEDADHGEKRQAADDEVARLVARQQGKGDGRRDEDGGEHDHEARAAGSLGSMEGGRSRVIAHAGMPVAGRSGFSGKPASALMVSCRRPCRESTIFATPRRPSPRPTCG